MAPVLTYKDLGRVDIALLTEILGQPPPKLHSSEASAASPSQPRQQSFFINLPSRLRSRLPCMAPGCPQHKPLNMAPLDDLTREFRDEASHSVETIWQPLKNAGSFSEDQVYMLGKLDLISNLSTTSCSACWLEAVGVDTRASVALGAFIIGRINPGIYQKSKRLIWIENMLRHRLGKDSAEIEIRWMWEAGIDFRRARKTALVECGEERRYVAEYVRRARDLDVPSSMKPQRAEPSSKGRSTIATKEHFDDIPEDNLAEAETEPLEAFARARSVPRSKKPPPDATAAPDLDAGGNREAKMASQMDSYHDSMISLPRADSSNISARWRFPKRSSAASSIGTQIVDLYRRSEFPHNMAFDARSSTDTRKRSPVYVCGRTPPESVQERSSSHCSNRPEHSVAPSVSWAPRRGTIHRRREEELRGRKVMPIGGHPWVNTSGI